MEVYYWWGGLAYWGIVGWDGRVEDGQVVEVGFYVWCVCVLLFDGQEVELSGEVQLVWQVLGFCNILMKMENGQVCKK